MFRKFTTSFTVYRFWNIILIINLYPSPNIQLHIIPKMGIEPTNLKCKTWNFEKAGQPYILTFNWEKKMIYSIKLLCRLGNKIGLPFKKQVVFCRKFETRLWQCIYQYDMTHTKRVRSHMILVFPYSLKVRCVWPIKGYQWGHVVLHVQ